MGVKYSLKIDGDTEYVDESVIMSLKWTSTVNSGTDVTPGSVCSDCIEVTFWTDNQTSDKLPIKKGTELLLYAGPSHFIQGRFICERPIITSTNTYKVTAYDYIATKLSDYADDWIESIYTSDSTSYTLTEFITKLCAKVGLSIYGSTTSKFSSFINADVAIYKPKITKVTYRQLLQYACEIGGVFAHMYNPSTSSSYIRFSWYTTIYKTYTPSTLFEISVDDLEVSPCDSVYLTNSDYKVTAYTDTEENTYQMTNNSLLRGMSESELSTIGTNLVTRLSDVSYSPCTLKVEDTATISGKMFDLLGKSIKVKTPWGTEFNTYVMETSVSDSGTLSISSTGNETRGSVEAQEETSSDTNLQNTINNFNTDSMNYTDKIGTATTDSAGLVKPDGTSIMTNADGTISAIGNQSAWTIQSVDELPSVGNAYTLYLLRI